MIKRIVVLEKLGSRPATARQSAAFFDLFFQAKLPWVLDFAGVHELTPQFLDGFFGKVADHFGPEVFEKRLTWVGLLPQHQETLGEFLRKRREAENE